MRRVPACIGWRVLGRHGKLGVVVEADDLSEPSYDSTIVVRGGVSASLRYHVPATCLVSVSPVARTLKVDVDVSDFVPTFGERGVVELRLARNGRAGDESAHDRRTRSLD